MPSFSNKKSRIRNSILSYDDAGRLSTVAQPGVATENYTWWADGTLKSLPGNSGTTRNLEYDEESRMSALKIGTTTKFEFGYGYDGGRRWSKDLDANVWSWLPCGVACKAGELVELQSTLAGTTWSTASTNLAATSCDGGLVRSGSQYVLIDLFGRVAQARDSSGTLVASATYDVIGVQRTGSGAFAAGIIRKTYGGNNEDAINSFLRARAISGRHYALMQKPGLACIDACWLLCREMGFSSENCSFQCLRFCNLVRRYGCGEYADWCDGVKNKRLRELCELAYINFCISI